MGQLKIVFRVAILFVLTFGGVQALSAQVPSDELFAQGYVLLDAGNAQAAKDKFEKGLRTDPSNPLAHFFLGKAYFILEKYDPAKAHLERSLELDPTNRYASDAKTLLKKVADATARANREIADWAAANDSHSPAPLELYLREFPNGAHAAEAKSQLAQVAEEQARQTELARQAQARQAELAQQEYARQKRQAEDVAWATVDHTSSRALRAYLDLNPSSRYADTAKEVLARTEIDPLTKLMWTVADNGNDVNWSVAEDYCSNLRLGGYVDWRLPTKEEAQAIGTKKGDHLSEKLLTRDPFWASTTKESNKAPLVFSDGTSISTHKKSVYGGGPAGAIAYTARCVRDPAH